MGYEPLYQSVYCNDLNQKCFCTLKHSVVLIKNLGKICIYFGAFLIKLLFHLCLLITLSFLVCACGIIVIYNKLYSTLIHTVFTNRGQIHG